VSRDDLQALRITAYEGDHSGLVRILGGGVRSDVLQLVGDALAAAAAEGMAGADELAGGWSDALRERGWAGDEELAAELEAAMGRRPAPPGRPLPVDLEERSELLEAGLGEDGGRIDLETGEVWRASTIQYFAEEEPGEAPDFEEPDRWLYVGPEGSHEGYRDMEDFIAMVDEPDHADRLGIAIDGRGAFRRFKDTISRWPDEQARWYRFSDERRRGRAPPVAVVRRLPSRPQGRRDSNLIPNVGPMLRLRACQAPGRHLRTQPPSGWVRDSAPNCADSGAGV
jgi:Uncharacterised protein family (UPF0158)